MTVYVDDAYIPFRNMLMCHMIADTPDELHAMAQRVGLRRSWFQDHSVPHYDVSKSRRALAVDLGAKEITSRELVEIARRARRFVPRS